MIFKVLFLTLALAKTKASVLFLTLAVTLALAFALVSTSSLAKTKASVLDLMLALVATSFSALAKELEKASVLDLTKCVSSSAYVTVLLVLCIVLPVLHSVSFLASKYKN